MSASSFMPTQAKQDLLDGVHQPSDTYMGALMSSAATLDEDYSTFSATGEASGQGYTSGGQTLTGRATGHAGTRGWISFQSPSWRNATITARALVIYNRTRANRVLAICDFGSDANSTNGTFTPQLSAHVAEIG